MTEGSICRPRLLQSLTDGVFHAHTISRTTKRDVRAFTRLPIVSSAGSTGTTLVFVGALTRPGRHQAHLLQKAGKTRESRARSGIAHGSKDGEHEDCHDNQQ